jgi:hypothetical protein
MWNENDLEDGEYFAPVVRVTSTERKCNGFKTIPRKEMFPKLLVLNS